MGLRRLFQSLLVHLVTGLILALGLSTPTQAAPPASLDLAENPGHGRLIGNSVQYWEDVEGKLDIDTVISQWPELPTHQGQKPVLNLGFTPHPIWVRLDIENTSTQTRVIILEHPYPSDSLHIHPVIHGTRSQAFILGYKEQENATIRFRNPVVRLEIPNGRHSIYMRLQHIGAVKFSIRLWSEEAFAAMKWPEEWLLGLLMGITLIMVFYNAFMFMMMRTRAYLSYVAFLVVSLFWLTFYSGMGRLTPPVLKAAFAHGWVACMFLMMFFLLLFTIQFLRLKERLPKVARSFQIISWMCLGGAALSLFAPLAGFYLSQALLQLFLTLCFLVAAHSAWKGYRPAYFYLISFLGLISGGIVESMVAQDILDARYGFWPFFSSYALQTVLLSLAIGDQIQIRQTNARNRIEKLNEDLQHNIKHINEIVEEKTRDIRSIMKTIRQGILSIQGADYQIHPDYSAHLEVMFGKSVLRSVDAFDFLFERSNLGQDIVRQVKAVVEICIGSDSFNFEANADRLPREMFLGQHDEKQRVIELEWSPILDGNDMIDKILVTARDVTEIRKLREQSDQQRSQIEAIGELMQVEAERFASKFKALLDMQEACETMLTRVSTWSREDLKTLFIHYHTMKGTARSLGFKRLCDALHRAEDFVAERLKSLQSNASPEIARSLQEIRCILETYHQLSKKLYVQRHSMDRSSLPLETIWTALKQGRTHELEQLCLVSAETFLNESARDLKEVAAALGKPTPTWKIQSDGSDLNPDQQQVLQASLIHMIRNSLDHGIEMPDVRKSKGKPETGLILLDIHARGDAVELVYRDDGRGLDLAGIRRKAIAVGLLDAATVLEPQALAQVIFNEGFSTAEHVSEISGRGIGMSAVKKYVDDMGGTLSISLDSALDGEQTSHVPFEIRVILPGLKIARKAA